MNCASAPAPPIIVREAPRHVYAVAIGSNRRHGVHGSPAAVVRAAVDALAGTQAIELFDAAPAFPSAAIGPSRRRFANSAVLLLSPLDPPALLAALKAIERAFGRRGGQRWGARVLDLDIILWSGGVWASRDLNIPHPAWQDRAFVVSPLAAIAPGWRDPKHLLRVRHHYHRLTRSRPS